MTMPKAPTVRSSCPSTSMRVVLRDSVGTAALAGRMKNSDDPRMPQATSMSPNGPVRANRA